jgi:hypothetical protein
MFSCLSVRSTFSSQPSDHLRHFLTFLGNRDLILACRLNLSLWSFARSFHPILPHRLYVKSLPSNYSFVNFPFLIHSIRVYSPYYQQILSAFNSPSLPHCFSSLRSISYFLSDFPPSAQSRHSALPPSVKSLEFEFPSSLPPLSEILCRLNVEQLSLEWSWGVLPAVFSSSEAQNFHFLRLRGSLSSVERTATFPLSLTHLNISMLEIYDFSFLPSLTNLKRLELPVVFNQALSPGFFPSSLTALNLNFDFNQTIPSHCLPDNLVELSFVFDDLSGDFNHSLSPGVLPSQLETLLLGCYDQPFSPGSLPESLTKLRILPKQSDYKLFNLPSNLKTLQISSIYDSSLGVNSFPPSVTCLDLPCLCWSPFSPVSLPERLHTLNLTEEFSPIPLSILPTYFNGIHVKYEILQPLERLTSIRDKTNQHEEKFFSLHWTGQSKVSFPAHCLFKILYEVHFPSKISIVQLVKCVDELAVLKDELFVVDSRIIHKSQK